MQKLSFILVCLIFLTNTVSICAQEQENLNTYSKDEKIIYSADEFKGIELHNQHGDVSVTGWTKDTILINIEISVMAEYREMADEVFENLNINKTKLSDLAYLKTSFGEEFHSNYTFRINYEIFMPSNKQLKLDNRFGNITISDISGSMEIQSEYGDVTQKGLAGIDTLNANISFGEAAFKNIGYAKTELYNANLQMHQVKNAHFTGHYCQTEIENAGKLEFDGQTARINIGRVQDVHINGKFCFVSINQIIKNGNIEISNGLLIASLSEETINFTVSNNNAPANLTLASGLSYTLHGEVTNGSFRHDHQGNFKVIKDLDKVAFSGEFAPREKMATLIMFNKNAGINIKTQK